MIPGILPAGIFAENLCFRPPAFTHSLTVVFPPVRTAFLIIAGRISILKVRPSDADVAELVDAQVSEACSREGVEVRFFSSAPKIKG